MEDVVEIAISTGHKDDNIVMDAVGNELNQFVKRENLGADKIHGRAKIVQVRLGLALFLARLNTPVLPYHRL